MERPKWIDNILNLFKNSQKPDEIEKIHTRFVKAEDGTEVELDDHMPDEFAESIARVFRTGKAEIGNYNEKTGKWDVEEID